MILSGGGRRGQHLPRNRRTFRAPVADLRRAGRGG